MGCQERSPALRTWRATDHDQTDLTANANPKPPQAAPQAIGEEAPPAADGLAGSPHEKDNAEASSAMRAWAQRCMGCHGQIGTGDGPQGVGLNVPDLSIPVWQSRATDAQIAQVIAEGRGTMPGFSLDAQVVAGLVKLIRRMAVGVPTGGSSVTATSEPPKISQ